MCKQSRKQHQGLRVMAPCSQPLPLLHSTSALAVGDAHLLAPFTAHGTEHMHVHMREEWLTRTRPISAPPTHLRESAGDFKAELILLHVSFVTHGQSSCILGVAHHISTAMVTHCTAHCFVNHKHIQKFTHTTHLHTFSHSVTSLHRHL